MLVYFLITTRLLRVTCYVRLKLNLLFITLIFLIYCFTDSVLQKFLYVNIYYYFYL